MANPGLADACVLPTAVSPEVDKKEPSCVVDPDEVEALRDFSVYVRKSSSQNINYAINTTTSENNLKQVMLGICQVRSKYKFRSILAITPKCDLATVEVYNSLRGGWSAVPERLIAMFAQYATCQSRSEAPQC